MLIVARRLQGIDLVILVFMFAMMICLVSFKVASARSELVEINRNIVRLQNSIRDLETEYASRASLPQLERWNTENLGLSTPGVGQYIQKEQQLAVLDSLPGESLTRVGVSRTLVAIASSAPANRSRELTSKVFAKTSSDFSLGARYRKPGELPVAISPVSFSEKLSLANAKFVPVSRSEKLSLARAAILDTPTDTAETVNVAVVQNISLPLQTPQEPLQTPQEMQPEKITLAENQLLTPSTLMYLALGAAHESMNEGTP